MNEERIIALWTETVEECTPFLDRVKRFYEHKITVLIMYDKVELREIHNAPRNKRVAS